MLYLKFPSRTIIVSSHLKTCYYFMPKYERARVQLPHKNLSQGPFINYDKYLFEPDYFKASSMLVNERVREHLKKYKS